MDGQFRRFRSCQFKAAAAAAVPSAVPLVAPWLAGPLLPCPTIAIFALCI